jgi:para-aminobenzoate synthetase/4-amino-4-deoxychorismate lyase
MGTGVDIGTGTGTRVGPGGGYGRQPVTTSEPTLDSIPEVARLVRVPLASALTPTEVLRTARADRHAFGLVGDWAGGGAVIGSNPLVICSGTDDPFAVIDVVPRMAGVRSVGVGGGWVGFFGYQAGRLVERLPPSPARPVPLPMAALAFYDHVVRYERRSRSWWFEALWTPEHAERLEERRACWSRRLGESRRLPRAYECGEFSSVPSPSAHAEAVSRALAHIAAGDAFQVNVCLRLGAAFDGDPLEMFCVASEQLRPRYGAYLSHDAAAVASLSPELFLRRVANHVLTSPIKGTVARSEGAVGSAERTALSASAKDRAENLMIVDLMRNDLGRVCRYGSIATPALFRPEEHPGVWHLVSDITGELRPAVSDGELLRATFPPGSVTGAPKVRAMELIADLEATGREVYTGAIGIMSPVAGLELSVAIRTFEISAGRIWLGVGGGVVAESSPARELEECFVKARPLLAAIGATLETAGN